MCYVYFFYLNIRFLFKSMERKSGFRLDLCGVKDMGSEMFLVNLTILSFMSLSSRSTCRQCICLNFLPLPMASKLVCYMSLSIYISQPALMSIVLGALPVPVPLICGGEEDGRRERRACLGSSNWLCHDS